MLKQEKESLVAELKLALEDPVRAIRELHGLTLRAYQVAPIRAIFHSVANCLGYSFAFIFPRQSGKNEIQAQLEVYLLVLLHQLHSAEMVKVSPTWKPQSLNAMRRLERVLQASQIARQFYSKEQGYIYRIHNARITFFSGQPRANIVGATASTMLVLDEAQDIPISKYDKEIAPMAASTNATRVFWGTAWTSHTLLAREMRLARAQEKEDGFKRVFILNADDVAAEVPAYGQFVQAQVAKLGRQHPMVKTQYYSEEIDAEGGLFPPERQMLMRGSHAQQSAPQPDTLYALTLDIAGEDEGAGGRLDDAAADAGNLENPQRDSTALTVFAVDLSSMEDALLKKPTYNVVTRYEWVGQKHAALYAKIKAIAELFAVRYIVVDATGVGAGLASFLQSAFGEKVLPFTFNSRTKSDLCWKFLAICDCGRFKDHAPSAAGQQAGVNDVQVVFWRQVEMCAFEILPGPSKTVRWGVPDGTRDPASGELVHDDLLISAALCAVLEGEDWSVSVPTFIIQAEDPLDELDHGF